MKKLKEPRSTAITMAIAKMNLRSPFTWRNVISPASSRAARLMAAVTACCAGGMVVTLEPTRASAARW
jgi:hypothetical protein